MIQQWYKLLTRELRKNASLASIATKPKRSIIARYEIEEALTAEKRFFLLYEGRETGTGSVRSTLTCFFSVIGCGDYVISCNTTRHSTAGRRFNTYVEAVIDGLEPAVKEIAQLAVKQFADDEAMRFKDDVNAARKSVTIISRTQTGGNQIEEDEEEEVGEDDQLSSETRDPYEFSEEDPTHEHALESVVRMASSSRPSSFGLTRQVVYFPALPNRGVQFCVGCGKHGKFNLRNHLRDHHQLHVGRDQHKMYEQTGRGIMERLKGASIGLERISREKNQTYNAFVAEIEEAYIPLVNRHTTERSGNGDERDEGQLEELNEGDGSQALLAAEMRPSTSMGTRHGSRIATSTLRREQLYMERNDARYTDRVQNTGAFDTLTVTRASDHQGGNPIVRSSHCTLAWADLCGSFSLRSQRNTIKQKSPDRRQKLCAHPPFNPAMSAAASCPVLCRPDVLFPVLLSEFVQDYVGRSNNGKSRLRDHLRCHHRLAVGSIKFKTQKKATTPKRPRERSPTRKNLAVGQPQPEAATQVSPRQSAMRGPHRGGPAFLIARAPQPGQPKPKCNARAPLWGSRLDDRESPPARWDGVDLMSALVPFDSGEQSLSQVWSQERILI
ncbi:unnamed protein product [Heligmosomoides polygyrus]|uniref:C2H2-type domain-containing protein n=1 Tax=Heligmosomoides polygyrus TaxID=6339 RepID=A0A3P7ZEG8_HELPZ|nr:unnamed protein product [Heligmosomoides polygyrus]